MRRGFTLLELLVVILIIGLITVVALPTVLPAISHRQMSEAGRILQGALVGARDRAIHDGQPSGIRLLPDPAFLSLLPTGQVNPTMPLAYNRVIPIGPAPEYTEGAATVRPGAVYPNPIVNPAGLNIATPSLVLEQCPVVPATGAPNPPTSWAWNIRVGDRVQLNGAGPWYAVVGPVWLPSPEGFVNWGPPGTVSPLVPTGGVPIEWLVLTDGADDNGNGWRDEGHDGVDNDGDGLVDEASCGVSTAGEWEPETWQGAAAAGLVDVPYTIRRRPVAAPAARELSLPSDVVIDATTWANPAPERSRLPVNPDSGFVDIMVNPDGSVYYSTPYATPASQGLGSAFFHFWLAERQDVAAPSMTQAVPPYLPLPAGVAALAGIAAPSQPLKGSFAILTLSARTGRIAVNEHPAFLYSLASGFTDQQPTAGSSYSPSNPFVPAEQGLVSP